MIQPTTVTPAALPALPIEERGNLPTIPAIYFVLTGDTVLYIGKAASLRQRWVAHHRLKQLNERGGCRIAWIQVDDASLLDELESACIDHFEPVLNGEVVPGGAKIVKAGEAWMAVRVPLEAKERIERLAEREERSVSYIMRRLVLEALEAHGDDR